MDNEKDNVVDEEEGLFSDDIIKGFLIAFVIIAVFVLGFILFGSKDSPKDEPSDTTVAYEQTAVAAQTVTAAPTTAAPTTAAPTVTYAPAVNTESEASADVTSAITPPVQLSTAEIITLFNESANKVKAEATSVVKNFEHRTHNEDKLVLPSVLKGMFSDRMEDAFKDDTGPVTYSTREEIIASYPVSGESWSSQLTEAEVAEASCTDNGTEYELTLKLHPTLNPEPGVGTAKAFDCIVASEAVATAPAFIENFSAEYYDCAIKCRIDKATGRTVWSNYSSPVIINIIIDMGFTKLDAQIGITFEKDYTIIY